MKLLNFSRFSVAFALIAAGDNSLIFGHVFETAPSRDIKPFSGMAIARNSQVRIVYARIDRENVHVTFNSDSDPALVIRQICGSGTTCTDACSSCGSVWCGTETGGVCDCSDSTGSCDGGEGPVCGRADTCEEACSLCDGATWCGTYFNDGSCECSAEDGSCSGLGGISGFSSIPIPTLSVPRLTSPLPKTTRSPAVIPTTAPHVVPLSAFSAPAERSTTTSSAPAVLTRGPGGISAATGRAEAAMGSLMLGLGVIALAFQL